MATGLLNRVVFSGGNQGGDEAPALDAPDQLEAPPLEADPAPGQKTRSRSAARKSAASAKTSAGQSRTGGKFVSRASVQKDIADQLNVWMKMFALGWSTTDPECAGVLNDTSKQIADDLASLMSRSEWVRNNFSTSTMIGDAIKAASSVAPLARAVYKHHLSPEARAARHQHTEEGPQDEPTAFVDPNAYAPWSGLPR